MAAARRVSKFPDVFDWNDPALRKSSYIHVTSPPLTVLYEDNHLLVIDKPAGLLSQSDRPDGDDDVLSQGKAYIAERYAKPGAVYLGLVHRLDRNVSGVMILARTSKAAARLSEEIREGRVRKVYTAVTEQPLPAEPGDEGRLEDYIHKDERRRLAHSAPAGTGKLATLRYHRIATPPGFAFSEAAVYEIELETGRFHQIRFQFASRGAPILGDVRYGAQRKLPGVALALHCRHMEVKHPTRDERLAFSSPPPFL